MYLGIDQHIGLVYEGYGAPDIPSIPTPYIAHAKLVERDQGWVSSPSGLAGTPIARLFRRDSFDPVNRARRGRCQQSRRIVQPVRPASRWT